MQRIVSTSILITLLCLGCGDKATDPPDTPTEYVAYVGDRESSLLYKINLSTHSVDSVVVPAEINPFYFANPQGTHLFFDAPGGVIAFDLTTLDTSLFWPTRASLAFSPDGKLVFISVLRDSRILRLSDMQPVCTDTDLVFEGRFSRDSKRLYVTSAGSGNWPHDIVRIHLDSNCAQERKSFGARFITRMLISADEQRWFFMNEAVVPERFEVYDVTADSIIFNYYQSPGSADVEQTSDSRYVFFTNPGTWLYNPESSPGTPNIYVYSVAANAITHVINCTGIFGTDSVAYSPRIRDLAITPDDRYLMGVDDNYSGRYVIVSVATLSVIYRGGISPHWVDKMLYNPVIPRQ